MIDSSKLLAEIEAYCAIVGLMPSTLCQRVVRNSKLPARLRSGGDCTTKTAERLRAYMAANTPKSDEEAA